MKKTVMAVAIAAMGTTATFAQNVTISGNLDAGFSNLNAKTNSADKQELISNGSSTSVFRLSVSEDLGGGLRAGFVGVHLLNMTSGQTGNASTPYQTKQLFDDEISLSLSGNFGRLQVGAPNSGMLETNGQAQPFGTALGGGYSSSGINRLGGAAGVSYGVNQFVGGGAANGRVVRHEKSIRYDTPRINGLSGNIVFSPGNDNSTTVTSNTNQFMNYTLNFNQGPLNIAYSVAEAKAGSQQAAGAASSASVTATNALTTDDKVKYTFAAANYTMGPVTVYAGLTTGKSTGLATNFEAKSSNVAAKYALTGSTDLLVNFTKVSDRVGSQDAKLLGLSAIYKVSKRTSAYLTYQDYNTDRSVGQDASAAQQTIVGMRHSF